MNQKKSLPQKTARVSSVAQAVRTRMRYRHEGYESSHKRHRTYPQSGAVNFFLDEEELRQLDMVATRLGFVHRDLPSRSGTAKFLMRAALGEAIHETREEN